MVGAFPSSHAEDVALAVAAAKKAFATWRLVPAPKRAEILMRAGLLLQQRKEQYARDMTREMGKVLAETRGDVQEAIDEAFYVAGEGRRLFGQTTPSELQNKFAMSVRMPLGVVGLITPWNFPMAIPSWKLFPALVSGNTCVIKPATDTPLSVYNLVQTLVDAGLPPGVVNIVAGSGSAAGTALVEHPDVRAISFTGSSEVGSLVAPARRGHVQARLARDGRQECADRARRRQSGAGSGWRTVGSLRHHRPALHGHQPHPAAEGHCGASLPAGLSRAPRSLKVGNGLDESVEVGPQVNAGQIETSAKYVEIALAEGAKLLAGGHALTDGAYAHGTFFEPTVLGGVTPTMRIAREEVFGPVVSLIEFDTFEQAIEIANSIDYGLSTALYTKDVNRAFTAIRDLEAGITYINAPTIGAEVHLPFGGVKHTGNGHREGLGAIDFFTTWKAVYVDYSDKLQRAQIDNAE